MAGCCIHGDELLGPIKGDGSVAQLSECRVLQENCPPRRSLASSDRLCRAIEHTDSVLPQWLSVIHHTSLTRCDRFVFAHREGTLIRPSPWQPLYVRQPDTHYLFLIPPSCPPFFTALQTSLLTLIIFRSVFVPIRLLSSCRPLEYKT